MSDTAKRNGRIAIWAVAVILTVIGALIAAGLLPAAAAAVWDDGYGDRYSGVMRGAVLTGYFEITYKDGSAYKGYLKDGQFDGEGVYTSADGWSFDGHFKDGIADGEGTITDPGLGTFTGKFKNGDPEDRGKSV
jgi:hypothetical protein